MTPMSPTDFKRLKYVLLNLDEKKLIDNLILDINNKLSIINNYPKNRVKFSISEIPGGYPDNVLEYVSLSFCLEGWIKCKFKNVFGSLTVVLEV